MLFPTKHIRMNPKVSILIPVYKSELFIEQCIRSVLSQSYKNIEYIVVNDASPDLSIDIAMRIVQEYPQRKKSISFINNQTNKGIVFNRNLLVEKATGDYVYFVDSDDELAPDAVEKLVSAALENHADIVRSNYYEISNSGIAEKVLFPYQDKKEFLLYQLSAWDSIQAMWQMLIRRDLFIKHQLLFMEGTDGCEDYLMTIYLTYFAKKIVDLKWSPVYYYRKNNTNSLTCVNKLRFRKSMCKAAEGAFYFLKERQLEKEYLEAIMQRIFLCKQAFLLDNDLFDLKTYYTFFPESNHYWQSKSYPFKQRILFKLADRHYSFLIRLIKMLDKR